MRDLFTEGKLVCWRRFNNRRKNSSALQGRWPEGPEGFPMYKSDFSPFFLHVIVILFPVSHAQEWFPLFPTHLCCPWMRPWLFPWAWGPLRPFGARPPARRDSFLLPDFTPDIQRLVETKKLHVIPFHQFIFPFGIKSPKMRTVPKKIRHATLKLHAGTFYLKQF